MWEVKKRNLRKMFSKTLTKNKEMIMWRNKKENKYIPYEGQNFLFNCNKMEDEVLLFWLFTQLLVSFFHSSILYIYSAYTAMQTFLIFIRSILYIKEWNSVANQKRAHFEIDRLILESFEIVMSYKQISLRKYSLLFRLFH